MNADTRMVHCAKLNQDLPGLSHQPYPGVWGQKIYDQISKQAWSEWLNHQTMLINELKLDSLNPEARAYLKQEMLVFLFGHTEVV